MRGIAEIRTEARGGTKAWISARAVALGALAVFASALALYLRTGAPSVLSGDQAEHQFTAVVVGVPHATGYPLFTMLNALAVRLIPVGDEARRVTMAVALYSALAVALAFLVVYRLAENLSRNQPASAGRQSAYGPDSQASNSQISSPPQTRKHKLEGKALLAALLAAATLALAPEFWSLATIAEVYTLQAALILALLLALLCWWEVEGEWDMGDGRPGLRHPLAAAALLAGLGATHHGSYVPIVGPALLGVVAVPLLHRLRFAEQRRPAACLAWRALLWGLLGFAPWLYLAAQFLLFRPFDYYRGQGLPYHPYWGNPQSWGDVLNLALGAGFRLKIFTHGWARLPELLPGFPGELRYQVGLSGLALGALGALALLRRSMRAGLFTLLIWLCASLFGLNVAADVPKAHVYFLPAYVIWSIWIGVGSLVLYQMLRSLHQGRGSTMAVLALLALLALPLIRGVQRFEQMDQSNHWDERRYAEAVLKYVEPNAVILCRWEACMPLRYLQLVEGQRLGVQLDQTEPEDGVNWADRVPLYAPQHPVYAISHNSDLEQRYAIIPVESVPDLWRVLLP